MKAKDRENLRYDKNPKNPIDQEEHLMFSLLPASAKDLLDVGCGVGTISLELQKRGLTVTGVDFSEVAIEKAQEAGLNTSVSDVDEDGLKFPDQTFDVVWAGDIVEHVFDPISLLQEACRVMRDDGALLVSIPNEWPLVLRTQLAILGRAPQSHTYRRYGQCKHHTIFSWELFKYMLRTASLKIEDYYAIAKFPFIKTPHITQNKMIGALFGRSFIVRAKKNLV